LNFKISFAKNFSGASRSRLENKRGIPSIVFLTDEREEIRQQANILVTEKILAIRDFEKIKPTNDRL
jgi:hypothetical protein